MTARLHQCARRCVFGTAAVRVAALARPLTMGTARAVDAHALYLHVLELKPRPQLAAAALHRRHCQLAAQLAAHSWWQPAVAEIAQAGTHGPR